MPVFRAGRGQAPAWCEMRQFDIVRLPAGAARYDFGRAGPREKLIVGEGACTVSAAGREQAAAAGANIDLPAGEESRVQHPRRRRGRHPDPHGRPLGRRGRRLRAVLGGGGGRRRPRRPGRPRPLREADPLRLPLPRLRRVLDPLRVAGAWPSRRGSATRSPQATAWPPAWATTTTSRWSTNRCGPSTSRLRWKGKGGGAICGTTRTGRRSRGWSGCEGRELSPPPTPDTPPPAAPPPRLPSPRCPSARSSCPPGAGCGRA